MNTYIKSLAFVLAAGSPCVAFAEALGAHVPNAFTAENLVAAFALVVIALLVSLDYTRSDKRRFSRAAERAIVGNKTESHRLAA